LAVILAGLAALQYQWIGQVSEAQRERVQATLRTAMNQFREDVHQELAGVSVAFEINQPGTSKISERAIQERYRDWQRKAPHSDLVANVFLWESRKPNTGPYRLNPATGQFELVDCPSRFGHLCGDLKLKDSRRPLLAGVAISPFVWTLEGDVPALVHPLIQLRRNGDQHVSMLNRAGYLVIELNRDFLEKHFFPDLVRRYFGGSDGPAYQVAVLSGDNPARPIYLSDSIPPQQILASPEDGIQLFGPPYEGRPGSSKAMQFGARGRRQGFPWHLWRPPAGQDFSRRFHSSAIVPSPWSGRWELVVKGRSGSREDRVMAARRRNLAISFGILLLLAAGMGMLLVRWQRAQRLAKVQIDFVAGVSHQLRTPLAVISSAADNLASGVVEIKDHVRGYGRLIGSEAFRLSHRMQQVLLFATGEAGYARYEFRPVEIGGVIDRALGETGAMIDQAGFRVEKYIQPGLPPAVADANALAQCLENLISNAVKYGHEKRWLGIRGQMARTDRGPEIEVVVEDKGIGIAREDLPHIFEPFYRGRVVTVARIDGTGLGLCLAKRFTEAMGGRLNVKSTLGKGSVFTLRLPAVVCDKPGLQDPA
jgi:signal transduction histidine kinase